MKRKSKFPGRFTLTSVVAAALVLASPVASALGLGRLTVQSALGESMQAEIDVTSMTPEEQANLKIRVAPPEAYRAASVDYNPVLPGTRAVLQRRSDGRLFVRLTSDKGVQEPFVDVILEISWATGRLVREYTLLFDPPPAIRAAAPQAPAGTTTSPVMSAAPPAPAPLPPSAGTSTIDPRELARQALRERREAGRAAAGDAKGGGDNARPAATGTGNTEASGDEYRVRSGDYLAKIAARTQRPGISLDQMLVALFRANPDAFMGANMNRLKAGVVLSVPSADAAQAVNSSEARKTIVAQSADFNAYRQRLAGGAIAPRVEASTRQAAGKVQASVDDRKTSAAPAPDKLTLSKGPTPGAAPNSAEERLSRERERQAEATRVAELSKNLNDLNRVQRAASQTPVAPPAVAPAPPVTSRPTVPVAAPPALAVAPVAAPASAPVVVAAASVPAVVATAPPVIAASAAASPASTLAAARPPASAVVAARPASRPAAPKPVETGLLDSILDEPIYLGLGAIVVLLAGFGVWRFTKRSKKDSGETSFLESRLQPDSFFGASGGQRIDTRDAGGSSSSMTYSLSQLDAIGDVDPVAEADVYLAYGRDLQAEEILKEAMRSNPERLAIRTKLLEVYAKRRDIKGFELLSTQLFALTRGEGEDWAKAQELGMQIDPDNPLYHAGGAPVRPGEGGLAEPLGASTLPQSIIPSQFDGGGPDSTLRDSQFTEVDFDLDNPDVGVPSRPMIFDSTESVPPRTGEGPSYHSTTHKMPLGVEEVTSRGKDDRDQPLAFDLSGISLDLDKPSPVPVQAPAVAAAAMAGQGFDAIELPFADEEGSRDPLRRKLELAEEFQRIGDKDGARDLLREVLATASGSNKTKAQGMLDDLG